MDCYFCDVALVCEDTPTRARDLILPSLLMFVPGANLGGLVFCIGLPMCDATMSCEDALYGAPCFITPSLGLYFYNNYEEMVCYML